MITHPKRKKHYWKDDKVNTWILSPAGWYSVGWVTGVKGLWKNRWDVALLQLKRRVDMKKYPPVCLPYPNEAENFIGQQGVSVGENNH